MIPLGVLASGYVAPAGGDALSGFSWVWRFEADSITGVSDGAQIATWPDTSGNGRDATQATTANRPTFDADAFGTAPGVRINDTTDRLATAALGAALTQPTTIWTVYNGTGTPIDGIVSTARHTVDKYGWESALWAGSGYQFLATATMNGVFCFRFNTSASKVYIDGGTSINGSVGTHTLSGLSLGNSYASGSGTGVLGAVLVINESQSVADMNAVGAYLATKFGYTWTEITA